MTILNTIETAAATEADKLRAEMLTEMDALETSFADRIWRFGTQLPASTARHIIHVIVVLLVFAVGALIGMAL